jgi:hypothetical protein
MEVVREFDVVAVEGAELEIEATDVDGVCSVLCLGSITLQKR